MRILVVDDEELFADGIRRGLIAEGLQLMLRGQLNRWVVARTRNGLRRHRVDLMMPKMNGWKVCRHAAR